MDININNLKYFADTATRGSTLRASQINFVSQPAISQGIKKLEEQIGLNLLNHKRNSIELTDEGKLLLKHSRQVFTSIENLKDSISKIKKHEEGNLKIAASSSIAQNFLVPYLSHYSKKYPQIDVLIKLGKTEIQKMLIEQGDVNIGITLDNGQLSQFKSYTISKGHFLLANKKNCPKKLLVTETRPEVQALFSFLQKRNSPLLDRKLEIESWNLILELIQNGFGHGLIPDFLIDSSNRKQFEYYTIPKIKYEVVLFHKKGINIPFHAENFFNLLKK